MNELEAAMVRACEEPVADEPRFGIRFILPASAVDPMLLLLLVGAVWIG